MVVGTLFLGFSVSFIWNSPNFPANPPWLKLFWINTFVAAMCYGFLAVWLAMHGAIAAQSASVQLLTRAVRPPYPTATELKQVRHELAQYEASPQKFFTPPNLLGAEAAAGAAGRRTSQPAGLELQNAQVSAQVGFKETRLNMSALLDPDRMLWRIRRYPQEHHFKVRKVRKALQDNCLCQELCTS